MKKLAREMAGHGVRHVFGIPGSGDSLTLLDALEHEGVSFIRTHFEGTGAVMAGAVGRLSGLAGACISIKGPGLANMVPGLGVCKLESLPVVSISEAYLPQTPFSKSHKRMDHAGLVSAVTKGRRYYSANGPAYSELASWAAREIPGPVHLEIAQPGTDREEPVPEPSPSIGGGALKERMLDLVKQSLRPVLITGTLGLRMDGVSGMLARLSVPVFSTAASKGVIDETLPAAAGVYTGVGGELAPESAIIPGADLIIGIGLRHNEVLAVKPFHCPSINLDPADPQVFSGFGFDFAHGAFDFLETVIDALAEKSWGLEVIEACLGRLDKTLFSGGFMPARVFRTVEEFHRGQCRLVLDTGNFCTVGEHVWRVRRPGNYLASGQGRYMGAGLPLAIGAAVFDGTLPTAVFAGDGGIGMFLADLKLAATHRLPLLTVLLSDSHMASLRGRALSDGLTQKPVIIEHPSWRRAVEGLGVPAVEVGDEDSLVSALEGWDPSEGPMFVETFFDPRAYLEMVKGVR